MVKRSNSWWTLHHLTVLFLEHHDEGEDEGTLISTGEHEQTQGVEDEDKKLILDMALNTNLPKNLLPIAAVAEAYLAPVAEVGISHKYIIMR